MSVVHHFGRKMEFKLSVRSSLMLSSFLHCCIQFFSLFCLCPLYSTYSLLVLPLFLSVCLSSSLSLCLYFSFSLCLSVCHSLSLFLCLCLSLSRFISLSFSLSPPPTPLNLFCSQDMFVCVTFALMFLLFVFG